MIASTIGYSGLIRIVNCFFLIAITVGCTSTGVIEPDQATIDLDSSVVAFSVNTGKLSEYKTPIRPVRLHIQYGDESIPIRLSSGKTGVQRVLLEVPAAAVLFSQFELVAGTGIFSDHYLIDARQTMELTQGEITYLGRIEIEDVSFGENADGSLGEPVSVRLVFADAFEDDQFAWEQQYRLFQNRVPSQQIVGNWAGRDFQFLLRKEWNRFHAQNNRIGSEYGGAGEATRGPLPDSHQSMSSPSNRSPRN